MKRGRGNKVGWGKGVDREWAEQRGGRCCGWHEALCGDNICSVGAYALIARVFLVATCKRSGRGCCPYISLI